MAVLGTVRGQNNPYQINDECFDLYQKAELSVGKDEFQEIGAALLEAALRTGDTKAQTLYYVVNLKHTIRLIPTQVLSTPEQDATVLAAQEKLKDVAQKYGFPQYYYYSYELVQTYYFNHLKPIRTLEVLQEMQQVAAQRQEPYGEWISYRYMVSLYVSQSDYITAKKYINLALEIYDKSTDPIIRKQSISRLYCDLSDTYVIGADSVRINVEKAVKAAKVHLDTLRCEYHLAKISAYEKRLQDYYRHRDYCLGDPQISTISPTAVKVFQTLDSILEGKFDIHTVEDLAFSRVREVKYIANVAEVYGYKDQGFELERLLVRKFENQLAALNQSKIAEMDVRLGNDRLSARLQDKTEEVLKMNRFIFLIFTLLLLGILLFLVIHTQNLRKHNDELKKANEKVMLADAAKTRFVQNMSHEVRTPLNAIVGFSQLLALPDGSFPEEEKAEFSGHIVNNTKMLTMLLDDILNASAMDSGNYRITYEDGEKDFIALAAISSAEHRLQPGVRLYYAPEEDQPFTFRTDPRRVQQILINLITNACKHTSKGEIKVSSSLTKAPGYVTYSITDTGPGIPPEQAEAIFQRFTKLNEFVQGTGLGLSICRDIADRMGAKVFLDTSYTEGGSRFVFQVPTEPVVEDNTPKKTN